MFENRISPLFELNQALFLKNKLRVFVKRDDLLHPHISGNKWRKLKYNLAEARQKGFSKLVTFGGAYSNHIVAVACAGKEYGFKTAGIIRGEIRFPLNPTLDFAKSCGMELRGVPRFVFSNHDWKEIANAAKLEVDGSYLIPMGGSNCLALKGCAEIANEVEQQLGILPDFFCVASGTGATAAGIIYGLAGQSNCIAFPILKGNFMQEEISNFLVSCGMVDSPANWQVCNDYHFGGYAKFNASLIDFINEFTREHQIPLDPVYTGKLFFGVMDLIEKKFFPENASLLILHTGGLQGIAGFNERYGELIKMNV
jgi:1-aminocyclopropane-1-carboxylate deaminase/D-cysteine desulfhydrase-like pyridoxal-dependent ACC family enzyme